MLKIYLCAIIMPYAIRHYDAYRRQRVPRHEFYARALGMPRLFIVVEV